MRTASRLNSSPRVVAIFGLLHGEHRSQKTGTEPGQVHGVYESLLDGMEVEELRESEGIDVKHYLMVDSHFTWWVCGRSYLCRMVDMLHMGYVDEVLFGKEVVEKMPRIMAELVQMVRDKGGVKAELE